MIDRLIKAFSAQGLTFGLDFIKTILLVPFFISNWGVDLYGSYLTCLSLLALFMSLDNGFSLYISNEYNLLFHKDLIKAKQLISSAIKVVVFSNILQCFFVSFFIFIQLNFSVFFIEIDILYALLVLCFYRLLFGSSKGLMVKTLFPIGYFHRSSLLGTAEKIVEILVLIPFVIFSKSFLDAIIFITIFKSIYCIVSLWLIYIWSGNSVIKLRKSGALKDGFKMYKKSLPLMFNSFFDKSSNDGLNTLVSITLGPATLPIYTTIKTLSNLMLKFFNLLLQPIVPEIGRLYSINQNSKIIEIFRVFILLITLASFSLLIFCYCGEVIYSFWLNKQIVFNPVLFCTLIISSFIYMYSKVFISYFISVNDVRALTAISIFRGGGILGLTYVFLQFFGLECLGWSNLIVEVFLLLIVFSLIYKSWDNKNQLFSKKESLVYVINICLLSLGMYINIFTSYLFLSFILFVIILILNNKTIANNYFKLLNFKIINVKK